MAERQPAFFEALQKYDPEFYKAVIPLRNKARSPGSLDAKTKTLISLALDAVSGANHGVKNLARQARALGSSEEEIREVMRLVSNVKVNQALSTAQAAFEE